MLGRKPAETVVYVREKPLRTVVFVREESI